MRFLITGGAGFIGTHLTKKLLSNGYDVSIIDNLNAQVHNSRSELIDLVSMFVVGDAEVVHTWEPFFGQHFDVIICLAAETGTGQSMMKAHSYCNSNISSIGLLNDIIVHGKLTCDRVILASSRAVYGEALLDDNGNPIGVTEADPINPRSIYAITKYAQEQLLFCGFPNVQTCALRFQNVYGEGQSLTNPYTGILSIFSSAAKNGQDLQLFGDGKMTRDFIHVSDVVDAILITTKAPNIDGEVFNVGTGVSTTVLDVALKARERQRKKVNIIITGEDIDGDIRHNFADISKIRKLSFEPKISFDEGVKRFFTWVDGEDLLESDYTEVISTLREKKLLK